MHTVNGRRFASGPELAEISGFGQAALANLWREREATGYPAKQEIAGEPHWEVELFEEWLADYLQRRRPPSRTIDRSGDPNELVPPVTQARILGVDASAITKFNQKPPIGWPAPSDCHHEELPSGRQRVYLTRRQLWDFYDTTTPRQSPGRPRREVPDPRVQVAVKALRAAVGQKDYQVAAGLAETHGGATTVWKQVITEARKQLDVDPRVEVALAALRAQRGRGAAEIAAGLAATHGRAVKTWQKIVTEARGQLLPGVPARHALRELRVQAALETLKAAPERAPREIIAELVGRYGGMAATWKKDLAEARHRHQAEAQPR